MTIDDLESNAEVPVRRSRWLPTGAWVLALAAPALAFIALGLQRGVLVDFWHHLARGRVIVADGRLLDHDIFTYTVPGKPLQDANWLTQVIYHGLFSLGGLELIQVVNALTMAAVIGVVVGHCRRASGSLRLACVLGLFAFFGLWQVLTIRPQTFSFLLFAVLYLVLDRAEDRPRLLLVPPLILALWSNLHGGFPMGFVPIGCFGLAALWDGWCRQRWEVVRDRRVWALGLCLAGSIAATGINPYGYSVYQYVLTTSRVASGRPLAEWLPPAPNLIIGKMWIASLLLVIFALALSGRRPTARELILIACFLPLAASAIRMIPWWLLIAMPIVAGHLADILPASWLRDEEENRPSLAAAGFVLLLLALMLAALPSMERVLPIEKVRSMHREEEDLEALAAQIEATPQDGAKRIYSKHEWGEYLGWRLGPDGYTIFMDGRIEIFPDDVWGDYWAVRNAHAAWQQVLDHYRVNWLVLDGVERETGRASALFEVVRHSEAWKKVGEKGNVVLFVRRNPLLGDKP